MAEKNKSRRTPRADGLPRKTNGRRNKNAGNALEQMIVRELKAIYPDIATSRLCNRYRDGQKVDLCNKDESIHGRLPYNIQCKNTSAGVNYLQLHGIMPDTPNVGNVIVHNYTLRKDLAGGGSRFETAGMFAIMQYRDMQRLLAYRRGFEILLEHIDYLSPEDKKEVQQELTKIGL